MSELERDLFGSSDSDSESEVPNTTSRFNGHNEQIQDTMELENDPIFQSIMSSHEDEEQAQTSLETIPLLSKTNPLPRHEPHPYIRGLCLHTNVLSHEDQARLMAQITEKNFFKAGLQNQAMCFGQRDLAWLDWLEERMFVAGVLAEPYCSDQWTKRIPLFDQSIMNLYYPGDGIKPHVDLARFEDGIVIISLLSAINMDFYPALNPMTPEDPPGGKTDHQSNNTADISHGGKRQEEQPQRVPSYTFRLEPGSIISIQGPARYEWEHGIKETMQDKLLDGELPFTIFIATTNMSVQVDNPTMVQHSYQMMPGEMNLSYAGPTDHPVTQPHYESTHHQHHSTYVDETAADEDSEFEDAQDALEAPSYYTQGETDEYSNIASRPDSELEDEYEHERQVTQEQQQQHYVQSIPDPPAEEIIKLVDTIPHVDLAEELEKIKARLGVLVSNRQADMESEIAALQEVGLIQ
ncbi:hypothetical protein BGZ80_000818 [Entomortierella chlamydospora]|uniref:Alpha-ketoglutarate-dependent dioxygenase AlkB-like domain-containing protein n=1 Tax=Entomortierella chlamydospora TaxID=101097 RepID=A0A9P6T3H6_9FUNG|nr:hypothetical protein BGZ80_000818 [Entomortierella chlamydospora]